MPGKRILLVDYDPRSLTHTREVLEGAGFDVSTCGDGITALDQFKSLSPDLVLLSAMLPKMHGFEVCSNIRKLPGGEKTPVVIITDVYKGKRYRVDAINKYGATEYIEKPIEDSNLVGILNGLVRDNGQPNLSIDDGEKTVQFNRELLSKMVKEEVTGAVKTSSEKKPVSDKPKSKDEISKKLEQSLAGLDLDIKKAKPRPKVESAKPEEVAKATEESAPATVILPPREEKKEPVSSPIFTSEDLFTDVIASVERELQSEKIKEEESSSAAPTVTLSQAEIAQQMPPAPTPTPNPQPAPAPEPVKASSAPTEIIKPVSIPPSVSKPEPPKPAAPTVQMKAPAETQKKGGFDSEMEKKLSSTLSGLKKKAEPVAARAPASPAAPKIQEPPRKPEPVKAQAIASEPVTVPKAEPVPPPKVEPVAAKVSIPKPETKAKAGPALKEAARDKKEEAGINFGQYLLLGKIATGGMAELFKAKRKGVEGFEKILAIKRILPHMSDNEEFVTMFIDEAKLAAQLTHHNICQIFDLGMIENSYYIAMEYVHGKDLRAVLKGSRTKNKPIPVDLAVLITSKICSALDYAHRKKGPNGQPLNLVHRDVSPQNILLSYEGEVKLVDFGIAKAATKVHVTQHGALKGKLLYMSPEQAWGKTVDKRSDIFSVGILLYELLTGRPLFFDENDTEVTILEKVREAKVAPVREFNSRVPQELEKIIAKTLKKNPDERYQSAYEMQRDLDNLFYSESYNATSQTLANFMRQLFPEEWAQEADVKDTMLVDKEMAPKAAPTIQVSRPPEKQVLPEPAPAPVAKPVEKAPEVAPQKEAPVAAVPETAAPKAQGFRDISVPDIMSPPEARKLPIVPILIAVGVIGLVLLFFLLKPKHEETPPAPAPQQTAPKPAPVQQPQEQQPAATTTPTPAPPVATEDKTKAAEEKKLADQKAAEEKKKEEQRKKAEEAKLLEEQKQAKEKAKEEEKQQEPAPEPEEVAEVQQPPVQIPPQQANPEPVKETPKETPKQEPAPAPAQPTVQTGDLVELTSDVTRPTIVSKKNPQYPPVARAKKIEGTVILSVLVNETGKVSDVKVLRGAGGASGLNEAAAASVRNWTFQPAVKQGKRVKVWVTYPIVFKLE